MTPSNPSPVRPEPSTFAPATPVEPTTAPPPTSPPMAPPAPAAARRGTFDGRALAWLILGVVGLGAFAAITVAMLNHATWPEDQSILAAVRPWAGDGTIWRILSESANLPLIALGVGMVLVLWATHHHREAVLVALMLIAITAGSEAVKQLVARPRPEGTDPNIPGVVYSFPSGHVLEAMTMFGILAIRLVRSHAPRILAGLFAIAVAVDTFLVGLSRVVLNAHWPSDALASVIAAAGVLGLYGLLTHGHAWATVGPIRDGGDRTVAADHHA